MEQILETIISEMEEFKENADKRVNGNKTAGQRSRIISLSIEKHLKEWRKASL